MSQFLVACRSLPMFGHKYDSDNENRATESHYQYFVGQCPLFLGTSMDFNSKPSAGRTFQSFSFAPCPRKSERTSLPLMQGHSHPQGKSHLRPLLSPHALFHDQKLAAIDVAKRTSTLYKTETFCFGFSDWGRLHFGNKRYQVIDFS